MKEHTILILFLFSIKIHVFTNADNQAESRKIPTPPIFIGPAIPTNANTKFEFHEECPPNKFINTINTTIQRPLRNTDFNINCIPPPDKIRRITRDTCPTYAVGYQVRWIEDDNATKEITVLDLECHHNMWVNVFNEEANCNKEAIQSWRYKCADGWALCGLQRDKYLTQNMQFKCCQVPTDYRHLTETFREIINDTKIEVLGVPAEPDPDQHYQDWHHYNCTTQPNLATTIYIQPRNRTLFQFKCIDPDEPQKIIKAKTCPYIMNGLYINQNLETNVISEIGIHCLGSDSFEVFKNHSVGADVAHLGINYKCSIGYGVCGMMFKNEMGFQNVDCGVDNTEQCGLLTSGYLFPTKLKLLCCKIPPEEKIPFCKPKIYYDKDSKTIGLHNKHPSTQLGSKAFNDYQTNIYLTRLIQTLDKELAKEDGYSLKGFNFTERGRDDRGKGLYQLIIKCDAYEIRTDKFKQIQEPCNHLKEHQIRDCSCIRQKQQQPATIKSTVFYGNHTICDTYWEIYAVSTFYDVLVKVTNKTIYKHYDKHAIVSWPIGLISNLNSTTPLKSMHDLASDVKAELDYHLCNVANVTVNGLDVQVYEKLGKLEIVTDKDDTVFHLQLVSSCLNGKYLFRYDIYQNVSLLGVTADRITVKCKIPIYQLFTPDRLLYDCEYVESYNSVWGIYNDTEVCTIGSPSCNKRKEEEERKKREEAAKKKRDEAKLNAGG